MREDWWDFRPTHHLHLQTNHKLRVTDSGHAAWARLMLIEWGVKIPDDEIDVELPTKLKTEASQILGWVVAGAVAYLREGLQVPESVKAATRAWQNEEDLLGQFLSEVCEVGPHHSVEKGALYSVYTAWAETVGTRPCSKIRLGKDLLERGGITEGPRGSDGSRSWMGLDIRTSIQTAAAAEEEDELLERLQAV